MHIANEHEALFIACEMERRAIRLYERAQSVMKGDAWHQLLRHLECDERAHLKTFEDMRVADVPIDETRLLLAARADDVLMAGGLPEMERLGAFESPAALLKNAAREEEKAAKIYANFADTCAPAARQAFLAIAREEQAHLATLIARLQEAAQ